MLSRRDKLLIQPWEDRRYKDHRAKVASALPAVDAGCPAARPHVALKLKRWRRELERAAAVSRANHALLQRLQHIMHSSRLDNRWTEPRPSSNKKVGLFFDAESLNNKLTARSLATEDSHDSYTNVKCYACEANKKQYNFAVDKQKRQDSLPLIKLK